MLNVIYAARPVPFRSKYPFYTNFAWFLQSEYHKQPPLNVLLCVCFSGTLCVRSVLTGIALGQGMQCTVVINLVQLDKMNFVLCMHAHNWMMVN